jgi:phosphate butyryltransferase
VKEFNSIFNKLKEKPIRRLVVANGIDSHSIEAAYTAQEMGWVTVSITGNTELIKQQCGLIGINPGVFDLIDCAGDDEAIGLAVDMARSGRAGLIMKGLVSTDLFMKAILNKVTGLLTPGTLLTHVTLMKTPNYPKPLLVGDVAIIPLPTLDQKIIITNHLIDIAHKIGNENPGVAFIAATEQVIQRMPATTDAHKLKELWQQGYFPGSVCDGPMGLDLAIDCESATIKNYNSPIAGQADCLLFPNIESGNVFYKTNTKFCGAHTAAIVVGTMVPTILSSRGDSMETKLNSIALAALVS